MEIVGILGASHLLEKTTRQVEEILEDSAARNVHRHAQAQAFDNSRWLSTASQGGRQAVDREPTETEDVSVCRQLTRSCLQVAMPVEGFRQEIDPWFKVAVSAADSAGIETDRSRQLGSDSDDTHKMLHRILKKL